MKKKFLGFILGLFLIFGLTNSGVAATDNWLDWYIDWDGIAGGETTQTNGHFDVDSPNAVVFNVDDSGVFDNYGLVTIASDIDGNNTLIGTYALSGTQDEYGNLSFDAGGTLTLAIANNVDDTKTGIATLTLAEGVGFYKDEFEYGAVSLKYNLSSITDGYLSWAGNDSPWVADETIAFSNTNMIPNNNTDEIQLLKDTFPEVTDAALFLASGGQVGATVPVPSAIILLGSGIIGLVGFRRKNS